MSGVSRTCCQLPRPAEPLPEPVEGSAQGSLGDLPDVDTRALRQAYFDTLSTGSDHASKSFFHSLTTVSAPNRKICNGAVVPIGVPGSEAILPSLRILVDHFVKEGRFP